MAPAAVGTKLSAMDIVARVTIVAASAELHLHFQFLSVASFAANELVCAVKNESSLGVVIKAPLSPVDRCVAHAAVVRETVVMGIIVHVATRAIFRRVAKDLRLVAGSALGVRVRTQKRETSQVVIEEDVLLPRNIIVAVTAHHPLGAAVRVIIFVAFTAAR